MLLLLADMILTVGIRDSVVGSAPGAAAVEKVLRKQISFSLPRRRQWVHVAQSQVGEGGILLRVEPERNMKL